MLLKKSMVQPVNNSIAHFIVVRGPFLKQKIPIGLRTFFNPSIQSLYTLYTGA